MIQLLNSLDALQKLGQQELNGAEAYKISKILNAVEQEMTLYNDARLKIINEYAEKLDDNSLKLENGQALIHPDKIQEFNEKVAKMNNIEIELNINQLTLDNLNNIKVTPKQLASLNWLINETNPSL